MSKHQAVFLDRDGVVNEVVFRQGQPASPRLLEEFVWAAGIREAIARLQAASFHLFVVTNQPDLARQRMERRVSEQICELVRQTLPIHEILVCDHDDADQCPCRKPRPGMLLELAQRWQLDLPQSFMIGDSWKDMQAGQAAGCQTILLERPYNQGTPADFTVGDLHQAVDLVLSSTQSRR